MEAERGILGLKIGMRAGPSADRQCLRVCTVVSGTDVNGEGYLFQTSFIIKKLPVQGSPDQIRQYHLPPMS